MSSFSLRTFDRQPVSLSYLLKLHYSWLEFIHFFRTGLTVLAGHILPFRGLRSKIIGNGTLCREVFTICLDRSCSWARLWRLSLHIY